MRGSWGMDKMILDTATLWKEIKVKGCLRYWCSVTNLLQEETRVPGETCSVC